MKKKITAIVVIAVMLFGVFGLTACNNDTLYAYKTEGKASIDVHVATKTQNDYCAEKWVELLNVAAEGKQAVDNATNKDAVDTAVNNAKMAIDEVKEERKMADFVLTITTSKTIFNTNDEIKVSILLQNQSGKDEEISYYFLTTPDIPTATDYPAATEMPQFPYIRTFLNDETISMTNDLGGYFASGQHEIKYNVTFYLNWGGADESVITLNSNTIKITIL